MDQKSSNQREDRYLCIVLLFREKALKNFGYNISFIV